MSEQAPLAPIISDVIGVRTKGEMVVQLSISSGSKTMAKGKKQNLSKRAKEEAVLREARLSQALRENLRRRKRQTKGQDSAATQELDVKPNGNHNSNS